MYVSILGNTEKDCLLLEIGKRRNHKAEILCPEWILHSVWGKRGKLIT